VIAAKFLFLFRFRCNREFRDLHDALSNTLLFLTFPFYCEEAMHLDQIDFLPLLSFRATKFCWILILSRKRQWWCAIERDTRYCYVHVRESMHRQRRKKKREREKRRSEDCIMQSRKISRTCQCCNVTSELKWSF